MDNIVSENTNNGGDAGKLTKDELKVYDRQIRLWGHDGQKRLSSLEVLLIGIQGLGAEIAKNLILCGIRKITLKDNTDVSILDRCSQFLIPPDSEEKNRAKASLAAAQKLNPNVEVTADTRSIDAENDEFVAKYDIVIATECSPDTYVKLNKECRKHKIKLFISDVYGLFGYVVQDFNFNHNMFHDIFPINDLISTPANNPRPYYLISALLKFKHEFGRKPNPDTCEEDVEELKNFINTSYQQFVDEEYFSELFCEMSPTTSIIGAVVAQAAMHTVMENKTIDEYNVFYYDHVQHQGNYFKF